LFISAVRILFIFHVSPEGAGWELNETRGQRALLVVGLVTMLILGLFPQWALPVWVRLAEIFS
jgi:hypothetical protein